jgi:hypothetical protein
MTTTAENPVGTGLVPPGVTPGTLPPLNTTRGDADEQPEQTDPQSTEVVDPTVDVDGVPPISEGEPSDSAGENEEDDGFIDPAQFRREIIDEVQRRFDRAVSRLTRTPPAAPAAGGTEPPPGQAPRGEQSHVDTTAIRLLARDRLADLMDGSGPPERRTVKELLDRVLPVVDWTRIDDQDEYITDLATAMSAAADSLVKVGSDRKVAQLRTGGLLPPATGQPGPGPGGTSPAQAMSKGVAAAKRRFPDGRRRLRG